MSLQPLPPPGIGIFGHLIPHQPLSLTMRGEAFSKRTTFLLPNGTPLLLVQGKTLSASSRMEVVEAATGNQLGTIRKDTGSFLHNRYFVENSAGMPVLETMNSFSLKTAISMSGPNIVAGGQPIQLEWKNEGTLHLYGNITWQGSPVARIEKETSFFKTQYQLHVAPGFDPFLAACVAVIVETQRKKANAAVASSGGGGG